MQGLGDDAGVGEVQHGAEGLALAARLVLAGDRLDDGLGQAPEAEQVGADGAVRDAEALALSRRRQGPALLRKRGPSVARVSHTSRVTTQPTRCASLFTQRHSGRLPRSIASSNDPDAGTGHDEGPEAKGAPDGLVEGLETLDLCASVGCPPTPRTGVSRPSFGVVSTTDETACCRRAVGAPCTRRGPRPRPRRRTTGRAQLSVRRTSQPLGYATLRRGAIAEVRTGFEPAYNGFANRCLTTWLPHHQPQQPF
jgi:hypothetical protein